MSGRNSDFLLRVKVQLGLFRPITGVPQHLINDVECYHEFQFFSAMKFSSVYSPKHMANCSSGRNPYDYINANTRKTAFDFRNFSSKPSTPSIK
jgi:hypothetical protein